MLLNCGVEEDSWESLGLQGDPTSLFWRRPVLGVHWKDWFWSWNSNTLATSCEELTHWKRPWCWKEMEGGGEGDDRGWDGWMASPTRWTWVWVNSGSWWWTGKPGMLRFLESQRVSHTRLSNWSEMKRLSTHFPLHSCQDYKVNSVPPLGMLLVAKARKKKQSWKSHTRSDMYYFRSHDIIQY